MITIRPRSKHRFSGGGFGGPRGGVAVDTGVAGDAVGVVRTRRGRGGNWMRPSRLAMDPGVLWRGVSEYTLHKLWPECDKAGADDAEVQLRGCPKADFGGSARRLI